MTFCMNCTSQRGLPQCKCCFSMVYGLETWLEHTYRPGKARVTRRILNENAERLNFKFEGVQSEYKCQIFGLGECLPTTSSLQNYSNVVVVPESSSRQGDFLMVVADHNSICQPRSKIDKRFSHLIKLIDTVAIDLKEEPKAPEVSNVKAAHHESLGQEPLTILATPTTILNNESIYVPIQSSHNRVIAEIEKPRGLHVILLYGGVGKGKSTLARYMYESYGKDGENDNLFEHVIWVSCANCSIHDARTKQFEVLSDYSPHSFGDNLPQEKSLLNSRIAKAFQHFVCDKKILIILDDVSDPRFLYEMWKVAMGAKHVKYLVTSQRSNICSSLRNDSVCIAMGDPTEEEAKAILASHVGLQRKVIPSQLQDIAKDMIEITEGNPLALACLASHFAYSHNNEDQQAWQDAYKDLQELLGNLEVNIVIGNTESAPRSLWAAMRICIESLDNIDAKKLLSLIYACKGELVPEVVLRVWHASMKTGMKTSRSPFMKSLEELSMRELVRRNSGTTAAHTTDMKGRGQHSDRQHSTGTMWSQRSLVKLFMQQNMVTAGEIRSLMDDLIGNEESSSDLTLGCKGPCTTEDINSEKRRVAIALCALFFDQEHIHSTHALTLVGIASNTTDFYDNVHDLRRKAMEPCIWMLDKPVEGKWTQLDAHCFRKVLLTYICNRQLDDESISHLLKLDACTQAQLVTLKLIGDICLIEEKPLFSKNNLNFLQEIVHLLHLNEGFPTRVQEEAARALCIICWKAREENSALGIVGTPGILHFLVNSLASNSQSVMDSSCATWALASLAYGQSASIKLRIASQEGLLASLVRILCAHNNDTGQRAAANTLQNLTGWADNALKLRIANEVGVVGSLVKCLALYDRPDMQASAAQTLGNLASTDPIRWTIIANEEGAVNALLTLLFADEKPLTQTAAARAIVNLSNTKDEFLTLRIAEGEAGVEGLMKCIIANDNLQLQENATAALANLALTKPVQTYFLNEEGALGRLVSLLSAQERPRVQHHAAGVFQNLAATDNNLLKLLIANEEGAVAGLVKCLSVYNCPASEYPAASCLCYLAQCEGAKAILEGTEGLWLGLSSLLAAGIPPEVQHIGAQALTFINPTKSKEASLLSAQAYQGRAYAFIFMRMYTEALPDVDRIVDLLNGAGEEIGEEIFRQRCFVKSKLGDLEGALEDANEAVNVSDNNDSKSFALQERGVLKRMMWGLDGALADLDEGLKLVTDDYECLKHRGYVKFLLGDEDGARTDAEWALRIKPPRVDQQDYTTGQCLGASPVEYMRYKLK